MKRMYVSALVGLVALGGLASSAEAQDVRVAVRLPIPHGSVSVVYGRPAYPRVYVPAIPHRHARAHAKARRKAEREYWKAVRRAERAYERTYRAYAWDPVRARYEAERAYWRVLHRAGYRFDHGRAVRWRRHRR